MYSSNLKEPGCTGKAPYSAGWVKSGKGDTAARLLSTNLQGSVSIKCPAANVRLQTLQV